MPVTKLKVSHRMIEPKCTLSEIFSSYQGEGLLLGQHQIFVRFSGCNLSCSYCDTTSSQVSSGDFKIFWPKRNSSVLQNNPIGTAELNEILSKFIELGDRYHSISCTGGEPLEQADFLAHWLAKYPPDLPIHLETNGTLPDRLSKVIDYVDWIGMDIKLPSVSNGEDGKSSGVFWDQTKTFLKIASCQKVFVKIVISGQIDYEEIRRAAYLVASIDSTIPIFLQPVTVNNKEFYFDGGGIVKSMEICRGILRNVSVLPQMHKTLGFH